MARIYDNIEEQFERGLNKIISSSNVKRVDFCVGYFNLRGWNSVVNQIDKLSGEEVYEGDEEEGEDVFRICRLLIGMYRPQEDYIKAGYVRGYNLKSDANNVQKSKRKIAEDFRKQLTIGLPTNEAEETLKRLSQQMKDKKVCVKLYLREPLHAKLYIAHKDDYTCPRVCVMGSSNLTFAGLTKQGELNAEFANIDETEKYKNWFDERWNDKFAIDITDTLIEVIDNSWVMQTKPYYIYLKVAYHLSEDARKGDLYNISPEFKRDLFDFQQNAVKVIANYLNDDKKKGAIIGDVVGLGKTITACAVVKIFEENFAASSLIVCPANLIPMWKGYVNKYDLKADVVSMTASSYEEYTRHYRLIVVDESHNLRNKGKQYIEIQNLIKRNDASVLLLTATPYNKDFKDLSNQLGLFLSDDQDLGIRPERYIEYIDGERKFAEKHTETNIRSLKAFERSPFVEDWNDLMKLFLVRRTRSFIKNYFAKASSDGRKYLEFNDGSKSYFPERIPKAIRFVSTEQYNKLYSEKMQENILSLKLPRYGLSLYIDNSIDIEDEDVQNMIDNLSKAGERMMGFCRSTFMKRIDSSGYSFLLTLYRHILRNCVYLYAINNGQDLPIADVNSFKDSYTDSDSEDEEKEIKVSSILSIPKNIDEYMVEAESYYKYVSVKSNVKWLSSDYFRKDLAIDIKEDCKTLLQMVKDCGDWNAEYDPKLNELEILLKETHPDEKIIVFTQYSDTAEYLYTQLKNRGAEKIDVATGNSNDVVSKVRRFSPVSNDADVSKEDETRILIATDVLSEGQNLQDSHIIVNFDLPWAIIRLIQRAGRVDRIGQGAKDIYCYSFFPADGIEEIINLRGRLVNRLNSGAELVGSDEMFFDENFANLKNLYDEKSGILDNLDKVGADLSSQAHQIWKNAINANPELEKIVLSLPDMANSGMSIYSYDTGMCRCPNSKSGVITYAKTASDFDILSWLDEEGNVVTYSQTQILNALECSINEPYMKKLDNHHELEAQAIAEIGNNMSVSGVLGTRFSLRGRIVRMLTSAYEKPTDLFYTEEKKEEIKLALDEVYRFPLTEVTKNTLRMKINTLREEEFIDMLLRLYEERALCNISEDEEERENKIICSMSLVRE